MIGLDAIYARPALHQHGGYLGRGNEAQMVCDGDELSETKLD